MKRRTRSGGTGTLVVNILILGVEWFSWSWRKRVGRWKGMKGGIDRFPQYRSKKRRPASSMLTSLANNSSQNVLVDFDVFISLKSHDLANKVRAVQSMWYSIMSPYCLILSLALDKLAGHNRLNVHTSFLALLLTRNFNRIQGGSRFR